MNPFQFCARCGDGSLQWIEYSERVDRKVVAYRLTCGHWFGLYEPSPYGQTDV